MVPDVEQVIEVPKIILDQVSQRSSLHDPQRAEQLVEVPTILYFLKHTVDIPVPRGGGRLADLQRFHLDRVQQRRTFPNRSLTFQFTVEVFKVLAMDRVRQRLLLFSLSSWFG